MINAVFFSNFLNSDKNAIGILTPIPLDKTTKIITRKEIVMNGNWKDSKIIMISRPMSMNKIAFKVSSKRYNLPWLFAHPLHFCLCLNFDLKIIPSLLPLKQQKNENSER